MTEDQERAEYSRLIDRGLMAAELLKQPAFHWAVEELQKQYFQTFMESNAGDRGEIQRLKMSVDATVDLVSTLQGWEYAGQIAAEELEKLNTPQPDN